MKIKQFNNKTSNNTTQTWKCVHKNINKKEQVIMNNNIQIDNCMYRYITIGSFVCTGVLYAIEVYTKYVLYI